MLLKCEFCNKELSTSEIMELKPEDFATLCNKHKQFNHEGFENIIEVKKQKEKSESTKKKDRGNYSDLWPTE